MTMTERALAPPLVAIGSSAAPLAAFENVFKIYGKGDAEVRALDGVNLQIAEGEFVAVMGPSGSGKSTAMNILGCLDKPTAGRYFFKGVDVMTLSADQLAMLRRHFLGFVFQGFNLLARTTALENLELPLIYQRIDKAKRRVMAMEALDVVGLLGREHHTPAELSGGQQQRVAIARAIVTKPSLLLADEPTGNLDSARGHEIMQLLAKLNRQKSLTVVLVTHEEEIAAYAGRRIEFRDGRIVRETRGSRAVNTRGTSESVQGA
ncbi:MAG: ABC transporter ATP-binding protein [Rhodospirillaceae bacterium]|nr:ABC transporter ATP-binding protein [Rhodospirillaceae bacterium]